MTLKFLHNSTALALCLALVTPVSGMAQEKRICADGSSPPCAAADQQAALDDVANTINAGQTPTAEQIDVLDKSALVALAAELDLPNDNVDRLPEDVLREVIKRTLGVDTDSNAARATQLSTDTDESVQQLAESLDAEAQAAGETSAEVAPEQPQPLDNESAGEVVVQSETEAQVETEVETQAPEVVEAEPAPAPEIVEAEPAPDPAPVDNASLVTAADLDAFDRNNLVQISSNLGLDIPNADAMSEDELRNAIKNALGMPVERPDPGTTEVVEADNGTAVIEESDTPEIDTTPLAAADEGTTGQGEVIVETLTEDDVRSSSEEFETDVIVDGRAQAEVTNDDDGDDDDDRRGLNNAETAAALGLGVLALSQILGGDDEVVSNSGDRVVVRRDGELEVFRDDDVLLRRPGAEVETTRFDDGSTRTVVNRPDGAQVITVRAADGSVLRRVRVRPDGTRIVLFDDTARQVEPVDVTVLPEPRRREVIVTSDSNDAALEEALNAELSVNIDRRFSLRQVRSISEVRHLIPEVTVDAVNFRTDSSVILPEEAEELADLGRKLADFIAANPDEVFLVEGHTDTVGNAAYNLALSDRRAESVALALVEYFDVPPENLVIQGYGESDLLVPVEGDERANRRATVRRITPLLQTARID